MRTFTLGSFGSVTLADDLPSAWIAPSSVEMARLDAETIANGIDDLELMERAGRAVALRVKELLSKGNVATDRVLILCGPGNNGGDGLVAARILAADGVSVTAVVSDATRYSAACLHQLKRYPDAVIREGCGDVGAQACTGRIISHQEFRSALNAATILVDALLGTGQRNEPHGSISSLVEAIVEEKRRRSSVHVLSVDIPTGINADTGGVFEPHIRADETVCIELLKRGMMQFPGREACGEIRVVSVGISRRRGVQFSICEGSSVPRVEHRSPDGHKGLHGRILVIGGCAAMPGASALAALGALRAGAGLVSRTTKPSWQGVALPPECMNVILTGDAPWYTGQDVSELEPTLQNADVVIIGPGLGRAAETADFLAGCVSHIRSHGAKVVIDADALSLIANYRVDIRGISGVITPHPGEASEMLHISTAEVQADRFASVQALYERYGVVSLLKGAGTVIWDGASGGIIARGTPYLATAGSGDVLSGIIGVCLKNCATPFDAALRGAYVHAVAGERASAVSGGAIIASDIAVSAASVLGELEV